MMPHGVSVLGRGAALLLAAAAGLACPAPESSADRADGPLRIVVTTTIVADLVRNVGGPHVEVTSLMGPGVDPHLYKPSEGDLGRMSGAHAVFYTGLHLEGKMTDVFEQMAGRGVPAFALAECIDEDELIVASGFSGIHDPHVWFDVRMWSRTVECARDHLSGLDPEHAVAYEENAARYVAELDELDAYVRQRIVEIPAELRVLVTAHDAFGYFGRAYGMEVLGLLGVSTAAEAGTADVQRLAREIAARRIPAMFVESSVAPRYIEALQQAVRARGYDVQIGGSLFSDALGDEDTPAGTYIGAVRHNVETIVTALR